MTSNSKAASLASRLVEPSHLRRSRGDSEDEDEDAIFAELEEEIENGNEAVREQGLKLLQLEMERMKDMKQNEHGKYTEITDEKLVVQVSARESRCVIHFYHTKFKRCEIMDKHLTKLAPKYYNTRFLRVFVENIPWLVEKLAIQVLPCVICFVNGVTKDRLVGFEELGNEDNFDTAVLELRLTQSGVISKNTGNALQPLFKVSSSTRKEEDDEIFDL